MRGGCCGRPFAHDNRLIHSVRRALMITTKKKCTCHRCWRPIHSIHLCVHQSARHIFLKKKEKKGRGMQPTQQPASFISAFITAGTSSRRAPSNLMKPHIFKLSGSLPLFVSPLDCTSHDCCWCALLSCLEWKYISARARRLAGLKQEKWRPFS